MRAKAKVERACGILFGRSRLVIRSWQQKLLSALRHSRSGPHESHLWAACPQPGMDRVDGYHSHFVEVLGKEIVYKTVVPVFVVSLLASGVATAQDYSRYDHVMESARVSSLLDQKGGPFGESINRQNGTVSFRQVDVTLPGIGPDINIVRTFDVYERADQGWRHTGAFLDWDIELPRISALLPMKSGGGSSGWSPQGDWRIAGGSVARCTQHGSPGINNWKYDAVLHVPDGLQYPILKRVAANTAPSLVMSLSGGSINSSLVTRDGWQIGCLPTVKNDIGEGFFAVSPDGTKYWFDWMVSAPYRTFLDIYTVVTTSSLLVTRVEDRHGNSVNYTYQGSNLVSITGNDGRAIGLEWSPDEYEQSKPYIKKVRVNPGTPSERVWEYEYASTKRYMLGGSELPAYSSRMYRSGTLRRITLPDVSTWSFQLEPLMHTCHHEPEDPWCSYNYNGNGFPPNTFTGSMIAPSGLKGEYTAANRNASRPGATYQDMMTLVGMIDTPEIEVPQIVSKRWIGPGVDYLWTYAYEGEVNGPGGDTRTLVERNPDGSVVKYLVNNRWRNPLEGSLLRKEVFQSAAASTPTLVENYTYGEPNAGGYPSKIGTLIAGYLNRGIHEEFRPLRLVQRRQSGILFSHSVEQYDAFARPLRITKASAPLPP